MKSKVIMATMLTLLFIGTLTLNVNVQPVKSEPTTWTVDDDGPADFSKIQDAVNAASPGDTIFVYNGTYHEHVVVNKTVSLIGENSRTTIIDGNGTGVVVHVAASNVEIRGFTIRNGMKGEGYFFGIWVYRLGDAISGAIIRDNIISNNYIGIDAILFDNSLVSGNTITDNQYGIKLHLSSSNNVSDNTVGSNSLYGIHLSISNNNIFIGNTISYNNITRKTYGVYIGRRSGNNILYHNNFVNNTIQAYDNGTNVWDNGYPSGGNYWSDYPGVDLYHGPYQDITGSDGIGDTPYNIDGDNRDKYPLMEPLAYPGDANGDGHVNFLDFSILANYWFNKPTYNRHADFNLDGKINLLDLSILACNWFKGPED